MDQKKLNEILKDHEEWMETNGRNGKRADLHGLDLSWADLHGAYLCGVDLRDTNFYNANLCGADISRADIRGANFYRADLRGAILPKGGIGRRSSILKLAGKHTLWKIAMKKNMRNLIMKLYIDTTDKNHTKVEAHGLNPYEIGFCIGTALDDFAKKRR